MEYLKIFTEAEARRVLNTNWTATLQELNAFISLLYARAAYEVRNLKLSYLWSKSGVPNFLPKPCQELNLWRFCDLSVLTKMISEAKG